MPPLLLLPPLPLSILSPTLQTLLLRRPHYLLLLPSITMEQLQQPDFWLV
jgi:hypothetical protein